MFTDAVDLDMVIKEIYKILMFAICFIYIALQKYYYHLIILFSHKFH